MSLLNGFVRVEKRLARRLMLPLLPVVLIGIMLSVVSGLSMVGQQAPLATEPDQMNVGFTFSRRQAEYLGMLWTDTFKATAVLAPNVVRLGAYWDDIERQPGHYDFSTLDWLLENSAARNMKVVLTVGMKAPRWPEYYLPRWLERELTLPHGARVSDDARLRAQALSFVGEVVRRYRDRPSIEYWQVENEPLDPSGRHGWHIGADFLAQEIRLVRELDEDRRRPIVVSMFVDSSPLSRLPPWRHDLETRARTILSMADVLGLDVYPKRGLRVLGRDLYLDWTSTGWEQPVLDLQLMAQVSGRRAWVLEAQAEPWEPTGVVHTAPGPSRSVDPGTGVNVFQRLRAAGFTTILFWGVEHWYMRQQRHSDNSWWELLGAFFAPHPSNPTISRDRWAVP